MSFYNSRIEINVAALELLARLASDLVFQVSGCLCENATKIAKDKHNVELLFDSLQKTPSLFSYAVIAIGSYINGKEIYKGKQWLECMSIVKHDILMHAQLHIDKQMLEDQIGYYNKYEANRVIQAKMVIFDHIALNNMNMNIKDSVLDSISEELIDILEFMCLNIAIYIDYRFNQKDYKEQVRLRRAYLSEIQKKHIYKNDMMLIYLKSIMSLSGAWN